jgi:hypothetical protein
VGVLVVRFCEIIEDCLENTAAGNGVGVIEVVVCGGFFEDMEAFDGIKGGAFLLGVQNLKAVFYVAKCVLLG